MSTKIITLEERFYTGEPTVQLVSTLGRDGRALREKTSLHMSKTAGQSPAMDFIRNVQPEPGKTIVLVIGLGDHETYGPNRNGDGFPSESVPGKISPDQVLTKHFQSYDNAHVFEHHVNHDPEKAIGKVIKAFWNPHMRRVEVLESFDHDKAPHLLEKITAGQYPSKSMGCAPAGALVHTPEGRKPIEQIALGDRVITHTGAVQEVTELHRRYYEGALYSVYTSSGKSTMTEEHPYAVLPDEIVLERDGKGMWRRRAFEDIDFSHVHWVPAKDLRPGAYVVTPFDTTVEETLTVEQCRFLGYYCAEGHLHSGTSQSVIMTHHELDPFVEEAPKLAEALGVVKWKARRRDNSSVAFDTAFRSPELFSLCEKHVGRLAGAKKLSVELMRQPREQQLAFLGAVINGDGGLTPTGAFYISTCNEELAHQYQHMGFRCGLYSRVQMIRHKPNKLVAKETLEYRVCFSLRGCNVIAPYAKKVPPRDLQGPATGPLLGAGFLISKVTEVVRVDFSGLVYNFEVEGDNSYVVGNHAVHNCKIPYDVCTICGNKAATRAEYCDHLKYEMGRIYPDGKQAAALNPSPRFFDSSWVIRPADRTGHMLKKVARDAAYELRMPSYELADLVENARHKAAALGKAADMEKVVTGMPEASATSTDKGTLKLIKRYSDEMAPQEAASLPKTDVRITIEYTPDEAIGTTDAMGLPMGIKELVQYFMGRAGAEGAPSASDLDCACKHAEALFEIFSEYPRFYDDVLKVAGLVEPRVNEKLANAVWPPATMVQDRALVDTPLYERRIPALPQMSSSPNTDVLTFTDPSGHTYRTNMGMARRATNALEADAQGKKYTRGAGYLGLGALLGTAGAGALLTGKRTAMRSLLGGGAIGGGAALGIKGLHEAARPVRVGDLSGPKVMTNEGHVIPAYTEMKAASWRPEMLYTVLRHRDGDAACAALEPHRKLAFQAAVRRAEVHDDLSAVLGPTLELEKVALLLEQSISALA